ncbi:MAG: VOC family protein [Planctomycetota bacterium]
MDAEPAILGIDHVGLHVDDVERSLRFYRDLLGLQPIHRPDLGFPGAWLRIGAAQELHLIGKNSRPELPPRERHWTVEVRGLSAWHARLHAAGTELHGPVLRPDGATQLFARDPDGHWLELLER